MLSVLGHYLIRVSEKKARRFKLHTQDSALLHPHNTASEFTIRGGLRIHWVSPEVNIWAPLLLSTLEASVAGLCLA